MRYSNSGEGDFFHHNKTQSHCGTIQESGNAFRPYAISKDWY